MLTTDQILSKIPDKAQVIVRAPNLNLASNNQLGIYWSKTFVEKERIAGVINACEMNKDAEFEDAQSVILKNSELEKVVEDLHLKNMEIEEELEKAKENIKRMKENNTSFLNKTKNLFS